MCTRAAGCFGPQMASYVMGHILMLERRLPEARALQRARRWEPGALRRLRRLDSLTVGLLGCGDLGSAIGRAAKAHGMRTVGLRRDAARGGVDVKSKYDKASVRENTRSRPRGAWPRYSPQRHHELRFSRTTLACDQTIVT